jgi:hypothetical protein
VVLNKLNAVFKFYQNLTFPLPADDPGAEVSHMLQNSIHTGHHILPVNLTKAVFYSTLNKIQVPVLTEVK